MRFEFRRGELIFGAQRGQTSWGLRDAPRVVGSDGTTSIVKIVSVSHRVENLNLKKVIKIPYLTTGSRQCFECFSDSYAFERFYIFVDYGYATSGGGR